MAIEPSHPRPRYHNRGLYLAALLRRRTGRGPKTLLAVVHIPQVLTRLVPLRRGKGRREGDVVRRYVHLGTGNYNPATALVYTDLGLFTAEEEIGSDVSALFNLLTGYLQGHAWRKLIVAPEHLHARTLELIREQADLAEQGKPSRIFAKLNSLVDFRVIEALYAASGAGVPIDLVVRGICCLRPGIPGVSESIRVLSIVDRFLEHSRIPVFGEGEAARTSVSGPSRPSRSSRRAENLRESQTDTPTRRKAATEVGAACRAAPQVPPGRRDLRTCAHPAT